MRALLAAVKPLPTAKYLMIKGFDGYSTNIPISDVAREMFFLLIRGRINSCHVIMAV